ncbi:unnamed protein product, partial [marine sediment metagenome]
SYYYMNCVQTNRKKNRFDSRLLRPDRRMIYNAKQNDPVDIVYENAGWHFSFLGDIKEKLKSWGHAIQYNRPPFNTEKHIEKCKATGKDLFGRKRLKFEFVEDLNYLPEYVLENQERFNKYIS